MKVALANLFALLFLCACLSAFCAWSALDARLERRTRASPLRPGPGPGPGPPSTDPSPKTFRALLAVPPVARGVRLTTNLTSATSGGPGRLGDDDDDDVGSDPVEDGCFWSRRLEERLSAGFTERHARAWRDSARGRRVARLEPGCGRVSNQLATFADGGRACVRYGINADQVLGEALTYCLAALLGVANLPPLALSRLGGGGEQGGGSGEQWAAVRRRVDALQWTDGAVVSLTEWVANLTGVVTPALLRQDGDGGPDAEGADGEGLHPRRAELRNMTRAELHELMQWSDLILLDYVTANFDRLASNLFSRQWDPRVMERDTSNLLRAPRGDLVFIDNEAGLVHGYRVLATWERYHDAALRSVCVFRRRTARRVAALHSRRDAASRLLRAYRDAEPLAAALGFLSEEHAGILQDRVDAVHRHIVRCGERYRL